MTEYEVAKLAAAVLANFLVAFTVFLSIVSAYVLAAFAGGDRLTKLQLSIVNSCFLASVGIFGFLILSVYRRFYALAKTISVEQGWIAAIDFSWPLGVLLAAIIIGCLVFMWNARDSEEE
jgi:uncharacterized integral membrane protein